MAASTKTRIGQKWSKYDVKYLRTWYNRRSAKSIANTLGRTESAVRLKAHQLGLTRVTKSIVPSTLTKKAKKKRVKTWRPVRKKATASKKKIGQRTDDGGAREKP